METLAIHQQKNSDIVVRFIELSVDKLSQYCSKRYAKLIIECHNNGSLWGVYFTKSGRIKATFI
jgi:hypothetical protein